MKKYKKAFINGKIFTVNTMREWAEAVVTLNDKILFAGANDAAREFIDERTEVIDLQNKLVLPGFIDSHAHIILGGFYLLGVDLSNARSKEEFRKILKEYIPSNRNKWLTGGNWNHENYPGGELPNKEWIDEITGDLPVFLSRMDYHMGLANSAALKLAGITRATPS